MKSKLKIATLSSMSAGNGKWMLVSTLLLVLLVAATQAADEKSVKPSATAPLKTDEIYIDDENSEGSGGRGGIHDDLEKDPDYSGSGFGPDDEDAITEHSSHNSQGNRNTDHMPPTSNQFNATTTATTLLEPPTITTSSTTTTTTTTTTPAAPIPTSISTSSSSSSTSSSTPAKNWDDNENDYDEDDDDDDDDEDESIQGSGDDADHDRPDSGNSYGENKENDNDNDNEDGDDFDSIDKSGIIDGADDVEQATAFPINSTSSIPTTSTERSSVHTVINGGHSEDFFVEGEDKDEDGEKKESESDVFNSEESDYRPGGSGGVHHLDPNTNINSQPTDTKVVDRAGGNNEVVIMSEDDRTTSFFAQPGILAAVIGGAVVGLLCAILVVMFIVYRMRKKDEGSYALDEPKRSPANNSYAKNANNREFYA